MQGVPIDSGNECVPQMGETVVFPMVSAAPTPAQMQAASSLPGVMRYVAPGASSNSAVPSFTPLSSGREMTPRQEQQSKEADLIRCIKAHLTLLQTREMANGRTEQKLCRCLTASNVSSNDEDASEEHSEDVVSEGELNVLDVASARDANSQQSCVKKGLKPRQESADKAAHKVKMVKCLLGELRALITDQGKNICIVHYSDYIK